MRRRELLMCSVLVAGALTMAGCGNDTATKPEAELSNTAIEEVTEEATEEAADAVEESEAVAEDSTETVNENEGATAGKDILPLPVEVDLNSVPDGEYEADIKNIKSDENGISADFTLYTMDLYDVVDMSTIAVGDVVHINMGVYGEEAIEVSTIEHKEVTFPDNDEKRDVLVINGGIEEGGAEFVGYEGGTYRYFGMDDYATSTKHGTVNLKIADDAKIIDTSDIWSEDADPNGKVIKTAELPELTKDDTEEDYTFSSLGTTVRTENGVVVEITKVYRP